MATGTKPVAEVNTVPFCGACGYPQLNSPNLQDATDVYCNSCGADVAAFGFLGVIPPTALDATGGSLSVTFTFTVNPDADSTDFGSAINEGAFVVQTDVASPIVIVAAAGDTVYGRARSVENGIVGNWSANVSAVATA
jgi:hypothetical protein